MNKRKYPAVSRGIFIKFNKKMYSKSFLFTIYCVIIVSWLADVVFYTMKKVKPERKAIIKKYTFSTPITGIKIISSRFLVR